MDAAEAQKQIQQMVNFILNEAKDKSEEIEAKAMEDFNIEKLKLVQQMKEKVRKEYAQKAKKIETQRAIARSTAINRSRLQKIGERDAMLHKAVDDAIAELSAYAKTPAYKTTVTNLIVQGCFSLLEPEVTIRCRQEDMALVESIIPQAQKIYAAEIAKQAKGTTKAVVLTLDRKNPLKGKAGGVVLSCNDGKIRVDNTLDARLRQLEEKDKPNLRKVLFPIEA
ncbi:vacuolar ATP synthase subunit E, putative [Perkinsus marinus ATCC 50983]|uniref:Vacuolar ATP synthase subunit E, putative n=2 Tax=Perkinsus marinus (strain ATCC 50983 / TXsc) TaxID=423536 RepID=C5KWH5_PERM5|nr:vacuolar ATP synthase subunit E, putative [Perkinsus marinus ATCC 50983]XP_002779375.1 vacuolar ATP synthase subunit E, putative [Perkinsus marinus ATCC 50983]EER01256.1 vacuolar ATP synthase subunit E, putative [Perkinsus marinus ATCC 50983]EER11170.1 vacuolar ATP synthase subunit E, putative [Perkinsus marinus ATCC 50983]|eukprot:XP_002768538.1 vacuolar ATP synthase subunit E, putative [Perkinsus marinus ATCC 50983]